MSESETFLLSPKQFFEGLVDKGFERRKIEVRPAVRSYLVDLLQFYLDAKNLFEDESINESGVRRPKTLAEIYMVANQSDSATKVEMLKKMADRCLYVSGFFSDSLQRKIVDVDYYCDMGGAAYRDLASCMREEMMAEVYKTFSVRFVEFVDVLNVVSHSTAFASNQNLLRLYEKYIRTGSQLARDQLIEQGVLTVPLEGLGGNTFKT